MSIDDFLKSFTKIEICSFTTDAYEDAWKVKTFDGSWIKHKTAGGCRNNKGKYFEYLLFTSLLYIFEKKKQQT